MSKLAHDIEDAFRGAALRPTAQRFTVLHFLAQHPIHATADEIFYAVNRTDRRASRATVYNSLRVLAKAGLVREVVSEGKAARFDANLHHHHHFICDHCGGVEDIPWFALPANFGPPALGLRAVRHYDIVFRGACNHCRTTATKRGETKR